MSARIHTSGAVIPGDADRRVNELVDIQLGRGAPRELGHKKEMVEMLVTRLVHKSMNVATEHPSGSEKDFAAREAAEREAVEGVMKLLRPFVNAMETKCQQS